MPDLSTYHIPAGEQCLVFAPLLNVAAAVNAPAVELLRQALYDGEALPPNSPLGQLAAELSVAEPPPVVPQGPARPPFLGLVLTRGCNMTCRYCNFDAEQGDAAMSPALVSQAISGWVDWVRHAGGGLLDLHFFGGEPFTQPDLVEIAVHRARYLAGKYGLTLRAEASTNGMLNTRMLAFVQDHFDAIVLSLDGQEADHDHHRLLRNGAGSFREVWRTAEALASSRVKLCIRCCVSDANVGRMADITRWLGRTLCPETIDFEPMKSTPGALAGGLKPPAPLDFARGFVAARRIAGELGIECVYSALYEKPQQTFCPVGRDTFIVAPDRSVRSCYLRRREWETRGLDLRIGNVEPDGRLSINPEAIQRLREITADRPRCTRCFCRWSCAGGCLVTETPPGHGLEYTDFCRQTRLIQACVLLARLGLMDLADSLLTDAEAVRRLWDHADDRLRGNS